MYTLMKSFSIAGALIICCLEQMFWITSILNPVSGDAECAGLIISVLPGRSCQHDPWEHYPACRGKYTSPSCHRWSAWCLSSPGQREERKRNQNNTSCRTAIADLLLKHTTFLQTQSEKREGNDKSTSLVMQPSLLRSYRLKAQLSLSVMEPRKMMDRLITKSYSRKEKERKHRDIIAIRREIRHLGSESKGASKRNREVKERREGYSVGR